MKKLTKRLTLAKETLLHLEGESLGKVVGGARTMDRSGCVTICATNCAVTACVGGSCFGCA